MDTQDITEEDSTYRDNIGAEASIHTEGRVYVAWGDKGSNRTSAYLSKMKIDV